LHFGLGREQSIREIQIKWPSGAEQIIAGPKADQTFKIVETAQAAAPAPVQVSAKAAAQQKFDSGFALARQGKIAEATAAFRDAVKLNPDLTEAHFSLRVLLARQGKPGYAEAMQQFMGRALPIHMDTVIAGAILADVGKLLEYELGADGKSRQSERGEALRHPFTGVALALECGVPDAVCHIIAAHAAEGDLVKRTTEAYIVHHADFMAFLPFKNPKNIKVK
jgi:tetratricopeptide (TPR) repeat protein